MTSALCLHKLYWEEWMPGKTAGHITFLPVSAKLHGLPTVIITTQRRYSTRERVWGISSGGSYVWAVGFIQIPPCILCECACVCVCVHAVSICVYDWFTANAKERKTIARRKEFKSDTLLKGVIFVLHPECRSRGREHKYVLSNELIYEF